MRHIDWYICIFWNKRNQTTKIEDWLNNIFQEGKIQSPISLKCLFKGKYYKIMNASTFLSCFLISMQKCDKNDNKDKEKKLYHSIQQWNIEA